MKQSEKTWWWVKAWDRYISKHRPSHHATRYRPKDPYVWKRWTNTLNRHGEQKVIDKITIID